MMSSYAAITRSRTETSVDTATSVSATAVTTSITLALPAAIATVCASDLRPDSRTLPTVSFRREAKDCPLGSLPLPAPLFSSTRARFAYALAAIVGVAMVQMSCSALEDVEGALDHPARRTDDVEIGFVRPLRVAHVGHLDHRVHVGIFDVAGRIRRRIVRLVFGTEIGLVGLDPAEGDDLRVECAVERGGEGRHLAPVRIAAGALRGRIRICDVLRDHPHAPGLRPQTGGRDRHRAGKVAAVIRHDALPLALAFADRGLEQVQALRIERGRRRIIHLVAGGLHHLLFEIDGVARGAGLEPRIPVLVESGGRA